MHLVKAVFAVLIALAVTACGSGTRTETVVQSAAAGGSTATTTPTSAPPTTASTGATTTAQASSTTSAITSTTTKATSTTTAALGPAPCRAAGLALHFLGQQGAVGHGEIAFALRNTGSRSCHTIGYPGVVFLDRDGAALPTIATHTTQDFFGIAPLRSLQVASGAEVSFRLGVTHGIASRAGCTTAYGVQVIPPNDTATLRASIPDGAYECGRATVSPLQAGTSAYP